MDEELMDITTEQSIDVGISEAADVNVVIEDEEYNVPTEEVVSTIEAEMPETIEIEIEEAIGWVGGDSERHYSLLGRDEKDQHPITAITGLREELNDIEALGVVYSDKRNQADYYLWEDENAAQENRVGYFVSVCPGIDKIKLCNTDNDIFGVTVDGAGFVGAQDNIARDIKYGLVATTGVVHIRCELDVAVGDYVISNDYGYATKNNNGYKVVGRHNIDGIEYAEITLVTPIEKICRLSDDVGVLSDRVDDVEINVVAAMNVANAAYNKASEVEGISKEAIENALEALGKANVSSDKVDGFEERLEGANTTAVQARAIAESAVTSAESIKNEAVAKANEALVENSELREEFNKKIADIDDDLNHTSLEIDKTKESIDSTKNEMQGKIDEAFGDIERIEKDLAPLAAWPEVSSTENPTGIAGFVARADEDSATLASVTKFEGEFGESITGFVQEATKENATVKAIASYQQKDANGNPYGPSGASALIGQVDANKASIDALASLEGDGFNGLAGLTAQVNKNTSSVATLASHVVGEFENTDDWVEDGKDTSKVYYAKNLRLYYYYSEEDQKWYSTKKAYEAGLTGSIAGVQQTADGNSAQLDALASYEAKDENNNPIYSVAGITAHVDKNSSEVSQLAKYEFTDKDGKLISGAAGVVTQVNANKSEINAVVNHEFTKNDGTTVTGLAGLNEYVNENESNVSLVASRVSATYTIMPKLVDEGNRDNTKIYSTLPVKYYYYNNNQSKWESVTSFEELDNAEKISRDQVYYVSASRLYWWYNGKWSNSSVPSAAGLPSVAAGIQVETDDNSASINNLTSWQGDTNIAMTRIEQKADSNGAYIQSTVSNMDKYSVGPYSQAYGFTLEQAREVLQEGMVYVPTQHSGTSTHNEIYKYTTTNSNGENITSNYPDDDGYQFTPGYIYTWSDIDNSGDTETFMWKESIGKVVCFGTPPSGDAYDFWYANSDTVSDGYEPYTLYKLEEYKNEAGETLTQWVAVATLKDNSQSRAVSQIRQDTNRIELSVTDVQGNVASHQQWLDDNSANIQDVVSWKSDVKDDVSNIATIKQTADAAGASIAQVAASICDEYETVSVWSTEGKDTTKVYYVEEEKKYYYYKDEKWNNTDYPTEAGLKVNAASIVTAINNQGEGRVKLSADVVDITAGEISLTGKQLNITSEGVNIDTKGGLAISSDNFKVDLEGNIEANGGTIGSVEISNGSIKSERCIEPSTVSYSSSFYGTLINNEDGTFEVVGYGNTSTRRNFVYEIPESDLSKLLMSDEDLNIDMYGYSDNDRYFLSYSKPQGEGAFDLYAYTIGISCSFYIPVSKIGMTCYLIHSTDTDNEYDCGLTYESPLKFCIYEDGSLSVAGANISGNINATSGSFTGEVNADSGRIGGIILKNGGLSGGINYTYAELVADHFRGSLSNKNNGTFTVSKYGNTSSTTWYNYVYYIPTCANEDGLNIILSGAVGDEYFLTNEIPSENETYSLINHYDDKTRHDINGGSGGYYIIHNTQTEHTTNENVMYSTYSNFSISPDGVITATGVDISGNIYATDGVFRGDVYANNGTFSGTITADNLSSFGGTLSAGTLFCSDSLKIDTWSNTGYSRIVLDDESAGITFTPSDYEGLILFGGGSLGGTWSGGSGLSTNSDKNLKHQIEPIPLEYEDLLDNLNPVRYKYNDGTSDRYHTGFIAQDVAEALDKANIDSKDFAGLVIFNKGEENERWTLRYEEFIALNTSAIQKLKSRVAELEEKVEKLEALVKE